MIALLAALAIAAPHHVAGVKPVPVGDSHGFDPGWHREGTPPVDPAAVPEVPPSPIPPEVVARGPGGRPRVALTFDACPTRVEHGGFRRDIVDWLSGNGVPATFFVSSRWAEWRPEVVKELAAEPLFEVESHGAAHVDMTLLSAEHAHDELAESQRVLAAIAGRPPRFFRPPKATVSPVLAAEAGKMGLTVVTMDVISADAEVHFQDETVVHEVLSRVKPGSIVGMHFNGQAIHTLGALPALVDALRRRGFELVTVSQLLEPAPPVAVAPAPPRAPVVMPARVIHHQIRPGDRLTLLARSYHTSTQQILKLNGLHDARRLRPGSDLLIPLPEEGPSL